MRIPCVTRGETEGREEDHRLLRRAGPHARGDLRRPLLLLLMVLGGACAQAGHFAESHGMLPGDSGATSALALGDLDGDGDLDLVLAASSTLPGVVTSQNRLLLNDGVATFSDVTASHLPAHNDVTADLALGDVDGDGDLDLLLANNQHIRLLLNDGTGVMSDATLTHLPVAWNISASAVDLADVDGDGDLDAWIATGWQNQLYLNGGSGVFSDATATHLPPGAQYTNALALGDVDGDGDLDALLGSKWQQSSLYLNSGGVFIDATASHLPPDFEATSNVALGDVDGDGDLDALIGNFGSAAAGQINRLYVNNGAGVFVNAPPTHLPAHAEKTSAVAWGDMDGDGDLDAVMANWKETKRIYINDGTGQFTDQTAALFSVSDDDVSSLVLGDVDGDGDLDALTGAGYQRSRVYLNDASGALSEVTATHLPPRHHNLTALATGDVDGDGDIDVFEGHYGQNRLHLNDGTGIFSDVTSSRVPQDGSQSATIAAGDVDGDGSLDFLIGNYGQQNRLYINNGTGTFADATWASLPIDSDGTFGVVLGDFDGDGDLDALCANDGQSRIYINSAGTFLDATSTNLPARLTSTRCVAMGDCDGDGDIDLLMGNVAQQNFLYLNNGPGVFIDASATNLPLAFGGSGKVALGDVDADGDLDAVGGGPSRLLLNNGSGVFTDVTATQLPPGSPATYDMALGDVDADGDLDTMMACIGQQNVLYANDGSGVFVNVTGTHLPQEIDDSRVLALADLDGDGDEDALLGNFLQRTRLYTNLTRHLAWQGIPRFGKPLRVGIHGPPNEGWVLLGSVGTANIPLSPWGTLRLDPQHLIIMEVGILDTQGRASHTYSIPPNPGGLAGLTVWCQAAVGISPRLTNLERFTFTDL